MSQQYDLYLKKHKANVKKGFDWLQTNMPWLFEGRPSAAWQTEFEHDASKSNPDEYEAYDAYFYGGNRSYAVVQAFQRAWLLHIHRNPHHWQHWVLINDDPGEGEVLLEMPYNYIIEMICDWWAFSWEKGNLSEIFSWYDDHQAYIKLHPKTRATVEDILWELRGRLGFNVLAHHGVKGQKWGVRNGPPYPLDKSKKSGTIVTDSIAAGEVSQTVNKDKQKRHSRSDHEPGRSYLDGDIDFAQQLVDEYSGTGTPICKDGKWSHRERVTAKEDIGTYVDVDGNETRSDRAMIIYSKTGTHIYPIRKENDDET